MTLSMGSTVNRGSAGAAALLILATAGLLMPSIRGHDGIGHYVYLMSIINDGDLDFTNEYAAFDLQRQYSFSLSDEPVHSATGRPANRYGIGAPLLWAPLVLLVHGLLSLSAPEQATGLSRPYEWAVGWASAWWGCLGVWILFIRLRQEFGSALGWITAAGVLAASSLGFYLWAHGSMSHAVSFFAAVMALLALERTWMRPGALPALALGIWAGLLALIRIQDLTWSLTLGAGMLIFWNSESAPESPLKSAGPEGKRERRTASRLAGAGAFLLGFSLMFLPQMAVWKYLYGSWVAGSSPYLSGAAGDWSLFPIHLWGALFSERGGVFAWHPILLMGVIGLGLGLRRGTRGEGEDRDVLPARLCAVGLAGFALQLYLVASWSMWWAGASFGNRFFISSYPFLALGIARCLGALRWPRSAWAAATLVGALTIWNCGLLVQYGTEMISREDEVGWATVLTNQFTEVPRWIQAKLGGVLG